MLSGYVAVKSEPNSASQRFCMHAQYQIERHLGELKNTHIYHTMRTKIVI